MKRRDFIGSVLGSLAIARLPFIAEPAGFIIENEKKLNNIQKAIFTATDEEIMRMIQPYITANFEPHDYETIKNSKIVNIQRSIIDETAYLNFKYEDILATTNFVANGCGLILKNDGIEICSSKFSSGHQCLINGDVLKVTHGLKGEGLTRRELNIFKSNENR